MIKLEPMSLDRYLKNIIHYCFYLLFFGVPLIFLHGHLELFQFNKMMLVYLLIIVITSVWLLRMILSRKIYLSRTPFDIPILLFLVSQVISTILSIEPHTSLWGYYSRSHGGLLSTISYILLYYAFVTHANHLRGVSQTNNNKKDNTSEVKMEKNISSPLFKGSLISLLLSTAVVSIYGILEHFGIDEHIWVQDVRNRVFSTLGQPNWLAAFLVTILPMPLALAISKSGKQKLNLKVFPTSVYYFLALILYLTLLYTKSRSGIIAFALSFIIFWIVALLYIRKTNKKNLSKLIIKPFIKITSTIAIITLLIGTPFTPDLKQIKNKFSRKPKVQKVQNPETQPAPQPQGGTPSGEIRLIVWRGAIDVWKNWPLFGSGVETFAYSYYNFRPIEHNSVSEWDFLYNKAHNEYLNFAATTGTFGIFSYLLLQSWFSIWLLKNIYNKKTSQNTGFFLTSLLAGYAGLSVSNFFGFSTVTTGLLFFILPGFAVAITDSHKYWIKSFKIKNSQISKILQISALLMLSIISLLFVIKISKRWYADRLFAKGRKYSRAGYLTQALDFQQQATELVPNEPVYHDSLSLDLARSASALFQEDELESALLFAKTAKIHSDLVMLQNPIHINFLKNRAASMLHLANINPDYQDIALETLKRAQKLSPTDPMIPYNLGLYYQQQEDYNQAIHNLKKSLNLKPDYTDPRLKLAEIYKQQGDEQKSQKQYKFILENIDPNNPEASKALEKN